MFLLDILVYVIFAYIMYYYAKRSNVMYPDNPGIDKYLWGYMLFYTIICAIRWNVGVDSAGYSYGFAHGSNIELDKMHLECLYYGVETVFNKLHLHFIFGMGLCAFVQIFSLTKALQEYKYILITLPVVLFGSRYYLDMNNAVRQMIVASVLVYASRYIKDRKLVKYVLFCFIGSLIHHSAWMLLLLYLLPNKLVIADKRWLMLAIFLVCFIAGQTPSFQVLVQYAEDFANSFGYDNYAERAGDFLLAGKTKEALAFGPMMLSYFLTALSVIIFGPMLKEKYENRIPYFNLWYNLSFIFSCLYFLICNVSHIFIRPTQYLELFQMIIVSLLLYDFGFSEARNQLSKVLLIVVLWVSVSWNIVKEAGKTWESTTYKVFFFHQEQVEWFFDMWDLNKKL